MPELQGSDVFSGLNEQLLAYARDLRDALDRASATATELSRAHLETVAALASAVDVRDEVTGAHVYRVANYGLVLAEHLAPELATDPQLIYGFLLHDIGKLAVPDRVLGKAGPLDPEEERLMRTHVERGVEFIRQIAFLRPAREVVATHHEAWDGSGYPRELRGDEIPVVTRMFTVCDAFDAMTHDRPYRPAIPPGPALDVLREGAGGQFDPDVVAGFADIFDRIVAIGERPDIPHVAARLPNLRVRGAGLPGGLILDALDDGLLVVSADGVILDVNSAFVDLFGLPGPPVGMTLDELTERTSHSFTNANAARARAESLHRDLFAAPSEAVYVVDRPRRRVVHRIARTVFGEHGEALGRVLVFRDVTGDADADARSEASRQRALPELLEALRRLARLAASGVLDDEATQAVEDAAAGLRAALVDLTGTAPPRIGE